MTDITGDLDLLGDWLDAKGYTEEAGLCTRAMDEINRLREALKETLAIASRNEAGDYIQRARAAMGESDGK